MSFQEQERALFDLLFEAGLRQRFTDDKTSVLMAYELENHERQELLTLCPKRLHADATMRRNLLLSQFGKSYPLSYALLSALEEGLQSCERWINADAMRQAPLQRAVSFGQAMRLWLQNYAWPDNETQQTALRIQEAELSLCWTLAQRHEASLGTQAPIHQDAVLPNNWLLQPIRIAPYVNAALLPGSYQSLLEAFCPAPHGQLLRHLKDQPWTLQQLSNHWQNTPLELLVARAVINHASAIDPGMHHLSLQLSEGFAPLFQHINGHNSTQAILDGLAQSGAPESLLASIQRGFAELLRLKMIKVH